MSVTDSTVGPAALYTRSRRGARAALPRAASISVVIPTLDEAANLPHVLARIPAIVDEVVVVDGHSKDGTIDVARTIRPDVRVVLQDGRGKGNALACGFAAASGDIIVMLDADASNDPGEIPQFVAALIDGNDFAKGSRFAPGGASTDITAVRAFGNRMLGLAVNVLFRTRYTDLCYGYNAFWRHCLPHMHVTCDGFEVETLIHVRVARAGLTVTEIASIEYERLHGESKLSAVRDGMRILRMIIRERVRRDPAAKHSDGWRPSFRELPPVADGHARSLAATALEFIGGDDRVSHTPRLHSPHADLSPAG
jgi:glycosyltransferase involved in cell wall biosynthesis